MLVVQQWVSTSCMQRKQHCISKTHTTRPPALHSPGGVGGGGSSEHLPCVILPLLHLLQLRVGLVIAGQQQQLEHQALLQGQGQVLHGKVQVLWVRVG